MTRIPGWKSGVSYSLQDIIDACDAADGQEIEVTDAFDGDLATVPCIIRGLVGRIIELENAQGK